MRGVLPPLRLWHTPEQNPARARACRPRVPAPPPPASDEFGTEVHQTVRIHGQGPYLKVLSGGRLSFGGQKKVSSHAPVPHPHPLMPAAKRPLDPPIAGDRAIYQKFQALGNCATKTAKYFNKGENVYPSRKQVAAAVERHEQGTSADYWIKRHQKPGGRPPLLDHIALDNLKGLARRTTIARKFVRPLEVQCDVIIETERKQMLMRLGFESAVDLINMRDYPISEKTLLHYKDIIWPKKESAGYVAEHRDIVKAEIRNMISCAAVGGYIFDTHNPACVCTSDHFAVRRNPNGDVQIIRTTAESQQLMREQNLQAGHDGGRGGAAVGASVTVPVHATMVKDFKLVAIVSEIWDDQMTAGTDNKPVKIYALDALDPKDLLSATCFSAIIAHGTPHSLVMHKIYKDVLLPKMVRIRDATRALREALKAKSSFEVPSVSVATKAGCSAGSKRNSAAANSGSGAAARSIRVRIEGEAAPPESIPFLGPGGEADDDDSPEFGPWFGHPDEWDIVFCLDGDSAPLAAILDDDKMKTFDLRSLVHIMTQKKAAWGNILFLKWAAGCSPTQSPNDVGKTHMISRTILKGSGKRVTRAVELSETPSSMQLQHHRLFKDKTSMEYHIDLARKKEIWRLLSNMTIVAAEAFRPRTIKASWDGCGFAPLDVLTIL